MIKMGYAFTHEALTWRLFGLLPSITHIPAFIAWQVQKQASPASRFYLAQQLATLFDQYLIYRLDWLLAWENNQTLGLGDDENGKRCFGKH